MSLTDLLHFTLWASCIEFVGALLLVGYVLGALFLLLRTRNILHAQRLVADGAIASLSFKLAGTLLKTIELRTWQQILMLCAILALRTILKRFFVWERMRLQRLQDQEKYA
ncbi:uncharacterized protein DUF1622 [Thermosporothrix hazakensis]|jgi:uncharacterized membrane protein|uniref:Uncharacterized protein DUF1622 n=1 Tax=Thermosporothrix hazakensis TaxID=644383 RepID=A0A326U534_THEHA|nr:DUF1622 domain-containing protein [Thermosporothrix hazakensis]PZW28372.1 uncharacterized protein DUF1622 [Thermosporothrix hazakensis]GCE46267.1 hypothetical protein KTH_11360 [Thermosporothrix hazakensis]